MRISWRTAAALLCHALGILGWCYVGGWMILTKPVKGLIIACLAGNFSLWKLLAALLQIFLYLSAAGAVWCAGYMLSGYFKDQCKKE